ncbi:hypothetical protein [Olivibacter sitiensis]|uniref:hypothetical protein n=1 Tax=Olivibacter sitiensis TaxID=376470 RepID=UPI000409AABA|nr:hypothetical protein [Olivibacter sitiensis]
MFKQITTLNGDEWYLIASLWIFLLFFIMVAILLVKMSKDYVEYMKNRPFSEEEDK